MRKQILNSDDLEYNSTGDYMNGELKSQTIAEDGRENSIVLKLPPLGMVMKIGVDRGKGKKIDLLYGNRNSK